MASRNGLLVLFLCLAFSCSWIQGARVQEKEKVILDTILKDYDTRIRPNGVNNNGTVTGGPTVVQVNMFIRSISSVDDKTQEYKLQVTLRQQWDDDRLKYDASDISYLTLSDKDKLWRPDLFFSNEKEGHTHDLVTPNLYMRIYPKGTVLYSTRLSLTLACPMNLKLFPLDRQVCSIRMASYGYTTEDMVFLWKDGDPVQVVKNLHIPVFGLEKFITDYCNSKTNTGEYSCLKVDLLFHRDLNYYLLNFFIPSVMLVMLSWVAFWLNKAAITARMLLGIMTLLAMAVHSCAFNASHAAVAYTRASDVWSGVCLTFLFVSILETASVHYLSRREENNRCCKEAAANAEAPAQDEEAMKPLVEQPDEVVAKEAENGSPSKFRLKERASGLRARFAKISSCSKRLDILSRILFPLSFILFDIVFVSVYVNRSDTE